MKIASNKHNNLEYRIVYLQLKIKTIAYNPYEHYYL